MSIPILPARQNFGSMLGQALGQGFERGFQGRLDQMQQQHQQQQELGTLQKAISQGGNDPRSLLNAILLSPISNETKKLAFASVMAQQKGQPTPYQEELLNQRKSHLDIQQRRLDLAREKGRKELPQMISHYTKGYVDELGLEPEDKLELDKLVQNAYVDKNLDLNQSLELGLDTIAKRREAIDNARIPPRPFASDYRAEARTNAMEQAAQSLQELYDSGITKPKDLRNIAKRGGWKNEEVDEILERVSSGKIKRSSPKKSQETSRPSAKVKFNKQNPEHIARAKEVLASVGGDREKANAKLAEEFSR